MSAMLGSGAISAPLLALRPRRRRLLIVFGAVGVAIAMAGLLISPDFIPSRHPTSGDDGSSTGAALLWLQGGLIFLVSGVRTRLVWDGSRLIYTGLTGSKVYASIGDGGRVVRTTLLSQGSGKPMLIWLDRNGQTRGTAMEDGWGPEQLAMVCDRLGKSPVEDAEPLTARIMNQRYPGTFPWWLTRTSHGVVVLLVWVAVTFVVGAFLG